MKWCGMNIIFACGCERPGAIPVQSAPRVKPGDLRDCVTHGEQVVTNVNLSLCLPDWMARRQVAS